MSSSPTVLIFTYPEHGQANVNLATSYELALAGVNVYIASFPSLRVRVSRLQELIDRHPSRSSGKPIGSVTFRECEGVTPNQEAIAKHGVITANLSHPYGVPGALEGYSKLGPVLFPWSPEEYLTAIATCKEIIAITKPDVVTVDTLFFAAQDACKLADQNFMVMLPTGIKESQTQVQSYLPAFWKYPALASGFSFPLEWWQIPINIYLHIRLIMQSVTSVNIRRILALRGSLGLKNLFGIGFQPGIRYICPAITEIDFPFSVIPEQLLLCGPIVIPFDPLEETDPALMKWLDNGPTVLVNLGSHVISNENLAREMASSFRILLDYHDQQGSQKIQVLWKVKADGDIQSVIDEVIGKEINEGKVRVVAWLNAEPISVLQHPNVICTVHHGGANSFYEGIWSGIPHIVLPVWYDTYDYARRAEYLNIGIFGNKAFAPGVGAEEFGKALVRVSGDSEEAVKFKTSAKRLRELCRARGNGRELASAAILKEVGIGK
ncbi:hypothetical protein HD554DRAFT_2021909 [Boletus coccyginus]|nr:hypothetical protein HD554DRAFT_2021909 [Boletus coccyginus]